uniref:Myb/SANT-like domain-containing protein n=1 Tax=Lactuca sativa TaxID=4236 RepID=A0A9R1XI75_LACSA|nr:hypothetical protein LSAT_V11C300132520 [Lactuca sativa]
MTGRNKHTQTTEEDAKLIEALLELHVSGNYGGADNRFEPGYLKVVQLLLDVSLPNSGLKAEPHIKSRMKTWKNHFNIMQNMDTDKCCVTVDVEVWDEYIKSHKRAACFRDKPLPQFDNLCRIFGKDRATGYEATDLGEDVTEETQRNSHVDVEGLEDIVEEMQQIARGNSKRKRPPTYDTESSYKEVAKEMKETFKEEARDRIDKVIEDIQCMPNINVKERIKEIDMFSKDQFRAQTRRKDLLYGNDRGWTNIMIRLF